MLRSRKDVLPMLRWCDSAAEDEEHGCLVFKLNSKPSGFRDKI